MTKYYHYTDKIIEILDHKKYKQNNYKPSGLWFSKNNEWYEWCISEGFNISGLNNKYELGIDFEDILIIDTIDKLINFNDEYSICSSSSIMTIDWLNISTKYKGIFFDNYLNIKHYLSINDLMYKFIWYYAIDVSSGCIFDISAIKSFQITQYESDVDHHERLNLK